MYKEKREMYRSKILDSVLEFYSFQTSVLNPFNGFFYPMIGKTEVPSISK